MLIENTTALISINATMVVLLASFMIFLFIINKIMFKPLNKVKDLRSERMEEFLAEITTAKQKVERTLATLAEEELTAKVEALQRQQVLEEDAKQQVMQIFDAINAEIDLLKKETNQKVQAQVEEVREHLAEESQKLASVIIEKTLGRKLNTSVGDCRTKESEMIIEAISGKSLGSGELIR